MLSSLATRAALVGVSAWLFVLAFPPHRLHLLAWIALVPMLVATRLSRPGAALLLAGIWGMLCAYGVTDWLPSSVADYYGQPLWLGVALFATAAFWMGAVEYVAFVWVYRWVAERDRVLGPLLAAAAWTVAEFGRGRLFTGNPWGLLGYTQSGAGAGGVAATLGGENLALAALQIAEVAGVYGVGFVLATANVVVAEALIALYARRFNARDVARVAVGVTVVAACLAYGTIRLRSESHETGAPTQIAIVQGNVDLGSQWREDFYGANLGLYLELTERALEAGAPALVVWPENAMTFFVDMEPSHRAVIARTLGPHRVELIAGAPRFENPDAPVYFNSAFLMSPDGEVRARYDKEHLLPFAEYFPFASVNLLRRSFARVREFTPGQVASPLDSRIGEFAVTICNEAMFPEIVTARIRQGADYIVNLTNDSWIPSVEFAEHQLAIAVMRSVEHRRFLVRASTAGPSAIVDPFGRVVQRTAPLSEATLVGEVAPSRTTTLYTRWGDWFAWSCLISLVIVAVVWPRHDH